MGGVTRGEGGSFLPLLLVLPDRSQRVAVAVLMEFPASTESFVPDIEEDGSDRG